MRRFLLIATLGLAAAVGLTACGNTAPASLSGPVPPTFTPVLPPDFTTATPIPPQDQRFFIGMGNGGNGVAAIQPHDALTGTKTVGITKGDVEQYVKTHPMHGGRISISYGDSEPSIVSVELVPLLDVYQRYMRGGSTASRQNPYPPDTPVYVVELRGTFRFSGGPPPGNQGIYRTGVWVFNARTGYDILEGGVGRIDTPAPVAPPGS